MSDKYKQIIPNDQSVVRYLDETFLISDLLESFKMPVNNSEAFITELRILHLGLKHSGYSKEHYLSKIETFINESTNIENKYEAFLDLFDDGINCNLLQPNGNGWQKGRLKICFEFIPEEPDPVAPQNKPAATHSSPLDEIRQLANKLASVGSIDQN